MLYRILLPRMRRPQVIKAELASLAKTIEHSMQEVDLGESARGGPKGWHGADVTVTDDFEKEPTWMEQHDIWVRTRHALEVSWLIRKIRDLFAGYLDFQNKYGFYGSLGRAALEHLGSHQPENEDCRPLLFSVLAQGERWAEELANVGYIEDNAGIVIHSTDQEGQQKRIDAETGKEVD